MGDYIGTTIGIHSPIPYEALRQNYESQAPAAISGI